ICTSWSTFFSLSMSSRRRFNSSKSALARGFGGAGLSWRPRFANAEVRSRFIFSWLTLKMSHAHPKKGHGLERGGDEKKRTNGERWLWRLVRRYGSHACLGCEDLR